MKHFETKQTEKEVDRTRLNQVKKIKLKKRTERSKNELKEEKIGFQF